MVPQRKLQEGFGNGSRSRAGVLTFTAVYDVFTLLMNLHDYETDPAYSVHIFRDAHTDVLLLDHTADHILTCRTCLFFTARIKPARFGMLM